MKIAFAALRTLSYFTKQYSKEAGGAETQQVILGRELAQKGHEIIFITHDEGQEEIITVDGITVLRSFNPQKALPLIGFLYPNIFKLWKALKKANADIYIQQGSGFITGVIALFCKLHKKKFVFLVGAERDTNSAVAFLRNKNKSMFSRLHEIRDERIYRYGLEHADLIVCQNTKQKIELMRHHSRDALVISNGYNIVNYSDNSSADTILWVGHVRPIKRPEMFLDVAKGVENGEFVMIGSFYNKATEEKIRNEAKSVKNIRIIGHVPYHKIFDYYRNACLLVNTSESEGFPNAFIEAWMHNMPVVSIDVNPDDILTKHGIGFHCGSSDTVAKKIKELLQDKDLRIEIGQRARKYVEEYHDINKKVHDYINAFKQLLM